LRRGQLLDLVLVVLSVLVVLPPGLLSFEVVVDDCEVFSATWGAAGAAAPCAPVAPGAPESPFSHPMARVPNKNARAIKAKALLILFFISFSIFLVQNVVQCKSSTERLA
jgi:hypothetical protein